MRLLSFLGVGLLLAVAGACKPKDQVSIIGADGSKVSTTGTSSGDMHLQATGPDGKTVTEDVTKNGISYKDSKGDSLDMSASAVKESDLDGLPFYPGSVDKAGGGSMKTVSDSGTGILCTHTTKDDPGQVSAFYKDKLENPSASSATSNDTKMATLSGKLKDGTEVTISATKKGAEDTMIMIIEKQTKKAS